MENTETSLTRTDQILLAAFSVFLVGAVMIGIAAAILVWRPESEWAIPGLHVGWVFQTIGLVGIVLMSVKEFLLPKYTFTIQITDDHDHCLDKRISNGKYEDQRYFGLKEANFFNKYLPEIRAGRYKVVLMSIPGALTLDGFSDRIKQQGLVLGTVVEVLAFGAKYPNEQRRRGVCAFEKLDPNSFGKDSYLISILDVNSKGRVLYMTFGAEEEGSLHEFGDSRFLALRRIPWYLRCFYP
ncbi:MAG: hypothetical protein V1664_01530 [Candidatus Uhrbacteria bacterium]